MSAESILSKAKEYAQWDINESTKDEVNTLISSNNLPILEKLFSSRIAFGTAGLRAEMGPGYSKMNDLIILQTSQGLARYITSTQGNDAKEKGVVIGYDHRSFGTLSSKRFARICASVFLSSGFKVFLLENFVATPFVPFAIGYLESSAGFMVTASHNPAKDNGFKMYWSNGSQIIPPHDAGASDSILANLAPWQTYDVESVESHANVKDVTTTVTDAYFAKLATKSSLRELNKASNAVKVTYTAMHGVGYQWIRRAFESFGHSPVLPVIAQAEPDPTFPTVAFPNPEEKGALHLAMEAAVASGSKLIIANDPDADRLAAAEQDDAGSWTVFSGNELGVLLGHWAITCHQKGVTNSSTGSVSDNTTKAAILASIVSSRMLKHIATKEGLLYYDTLTGFKWLGNRAVELRATGVPVLFSYEEALGYCVGDIICDKDGLSAAAHFVEMTHHLYSQGLTILQHYRQLEAKYGVFVSYNSYVICYDNKTTDAIFARLRSGGSTGSYWTSCCNCAITAIKDVTLGYDSTTVDHKSTLPVTADSHMIMFEFENSVTVTLRTSGTEPKIKFYTEIAGRPGQQRQELEPLLHTFVNALVNEMLQPDLHGLVRA